MSAVESDGMQVSDVRLLTFGQAVIALAIAAYWWWSGEQLRYIAGAGFGFAGGLLVAFNNRRRVLEEIASAKRYKEWRENLWQTDRDLASVMYEHDQDRREAEAARAKMR